MPKFTIELDVSNIGPHTNDKCIHFRQEVNTNKLLFYALNGTGKTFISRAFRLASNKRFINNEDDLLSIKENKGVLLFCCDNKTLKIEVNRGELPVIQNGTDLIFHVFNSDFVDNNVKENNYEPNGDIEGYILGKTQIDLHEERNKQDQLEAEIESLKKNIESKISSSRQLLKDKGINKKTSEYGLFDLNNILEYRPQNVTETVESIEQSLSVLINAPDNISDVKSPSFSVITAPLYKAKEYIETIYPKSEWDESFVVGYKNKQHFIEEGLKIDPTDSVCPFCGRNHDNYSLGLIKQYRAYLEDKESQTIREINDCINQIERIKQIVEQYLMDIKITNGDCLEISQYFPSLKATAVSIPLVSKEFYDALDRLLAILDTKKENLSKVLEFDDMLITTIEKEISKLIKVADYNSEIVRKINEAKQKSSKELLSLKKDLCKACYEKCYQESKDDADRLKKLSLDLSDLKKEIYEKEMQVQTSKKVKVYDTLNKLLHLFFEEKYILDEDSFELVFSGESLGNKAPKVLSDGEKNIVAFCLYLAYTHELVSSEEDYNKLFFVIDDPISSMDFNYVYTVVQIIRSIDRYLNIGERQRMWVFTHNYEFASLLTRNKVFTSLFCMTPGRIEKFDNRNLLPYENHLLDIHKIAKGDGFITHTTGNSIRHVIETIMRFENSHKDIKDYIDNNEILSKDPTIYSLCNDQSHGAIRFEVSDGPEQIKRACQTVIKYIENEYPGQLRVNSSEGDD